MAETDKASERIAPGAVSSSSPSLRSAGARVLAGILACAVLLGCAGEPRTSPPVSSLRSGNLTVGPVGRVLFEYEHDTLQLVRAWIAGSRGEHPGSDRGQLPLLIDRAAVATLPFAFERIGRGRKPLEVRVVRQQVRELPPVRRGDTFRSQPGFTYSLHDERGLKRATVEESLREIPMRAGWGFVRTFVLEPGDRGCTLELDLVHPVGPSSGGGVISSGPPFSHDWSLHGVGRSQSYQYSAETGPHQVVTRSRPRGVGYEDGTFSVTLDCHPIRFELAEQFVDRWDEELGRALRDELEACR